MLPKSAPLSGGQPLPDTGTHSVALGKIVADQKAVDAGLRMIWPRLREDQHGPMCLALVGLLDARATLEHARLVVEQELMA